MPEQTQKTQIPETKSGSLSESQPHVLWNRLLWAVPFGAVFLPIVLLSVYAYQVAAGSVRELIEAEHLAAVSNLSDLMTQDFHRSLTLARAIASVPLTVQAVEERNAFTIASRLKAVVVAYPNIDHAYVTDQTGMLWGEFPTGSGSYGTDLSSRAWFSAIRDKRTPLIEGVTLRRDRYREEPIVTIAVPIQSATGAFLGGMVFEYHAGQVTKWLQNVKIAHGGHLLVVDHNGGLVAHPTQSARNSIYAEYGNIVPLQDALAGKLHTTEYIDPLSGTRMVATFLPVAVGRNTWVIVAQQPAELAYGELRVIRRNIAIAGGSLSLVTLMLIVALGQMSARNIRLNRELQSKNATLRDITSFVSHQLRAPITAMRWSMESLVDGDFGEMSDGVHEELKKLYDVVIQNGALINDILNVSRLDRGVIEVKVSPVTLGEIAERAVRDYRVPCKKAGLALTISGSDAGTRVLADGEKLAEAVSNAVSNAIKHTKSGGITLTLRRQKGYGFIDVTDTGEGMIPEIMTHLFDRTGIHGSNTDASQSTGLGLFIARQFTRLMGGDVTVRSIPGRGSTFSYSVPLDTTEEGRG